MSDINQVVLQGRLGADPELRYLPNQTPVCNLSIAVSKRWKDKNSGENKEQTHWFDVAVFGAQADACNQHLAKGQQVTVAGELQQDTWQAQDGSKRSKVKVKAHQVSFGPRPQNSQSGVAPPDDDIPWSHGAFDP